MTSLTLARHAMATRFELVLFGEHATALQAAGEEALDEIDRWEAQLSLYRASSAVADLNARAHREPVRIEPRLFQLLQAAQQLHRDTAGAFDVTVGPLVRCWGFMGRRARIPSPEALAEAQANVGMHLVELDPRHYTVRFLRAGVMLDLGAIGKGYAVEQAIQLLTEAGVSRALLHGGTSSIATLGAPPDADAWNVGIEMPASIRGSAQDSRVEPNGCAETGSFALRVGGSMSPGGAGGSNVLAVVPLCNASLSVSAMHGKCFEASGRTCGHVIDPRSGHPADAAVLAAVVLPSATEADALSTALLTLGSAGWNGLLRHRPALKGLVVESPPSAGPLRVEARGMRLGT